MNEATIALVIKIIEVLISLAENAPEIASAAKAIVEELSGGEPISDEKRAEIHALLERAHSALQAPLPDEPLRDDASGTG